MYVSIGDGAHLFEGPQYEPTVAAAFFKAVHEEMMPAAVETIELVVGQVQGDDEVVPVSLGSEQRTVALHDQPCFTIDQVFPGAAALVQAGQAQRVNVVCHKKTAASVNIDKGCTGWGLKTISVLGDLPVALGLVDGVNHAPPLLLQSPGPMAMPSSAISQDPLTRYIRQVRTCLTRPSGLDWIVRVCVGGRSVGAAGSHEHTDTHVRHGHRP